MLQIPKRIKRLFAFLVGFMMIAGQSGYLSLSTVYGETEDFETTETVYMLTDKLEPGQNYIVASGNNGSVSILERNDNEIASAKADVISDENGTYIKAPSSGAVWAAIDGDESGSMLVNGDYAVGLDEIGDLILSKDAGDEVSLYVESEIPIGQDEEADSKRGPPEGDDSAALKDENTPTDVKEEPVPKAAGATIGEPESGSVLAFTSDIHNASNNTAANRLDTWLGKVAAIHGGISAMSFCGDMGSASAGESQFWDYTQAVMNVVSDRGIPGVYTTGNHEFYNGNYSSTSNTVKNKYVVGDVGREGSNYIIYCMGTANWSGNSDNFTAAQITSLTNYLNSVGNTKPIIVLVHFPLHRYSSRATANADQVIDALNDAADDGKKIVLLWGHNHTMSDTNYDQIFVPGDTITYNSSGASKQINFYYGAAGCMSDSEYGSGSAFVKGKGLVITINNKSQMSFTYYDANANNVTEGGTLTEQDPVPAQSIAVSPTETEVEVGRTAKLTVSFTPADTTNKSITWTSNKPNIATVDQKGKVKGISEGTATITATSADGDFTATCEVTVVPRTSADLNYVIKAGDYVLSTEESTDQATTSSSSWGSSSYVYKGLVAIADSPAAGIDEDTRWILEESEDGNGYYIKSLDGRFLNATYTSSGSSWNSSSQGNLKLDETSDVWVVEGNYLKSTNASNGNNSAKYLAEETGQAGTHLFTVRSKDNADETTIEEADDPIPVEGITLDKSEVTVESGKTVQLTAAVQPENATNKSVVWSSNKKSVATVDSKGKVKGVAEGTAVITATTEDGGKTAICEVTVTAGTSNETSYIITIDGFALSNIRSGNSAAGGSSSYTYTGLEGISYSSDGTDDSILWIMEETNGGYYIKSADGLYLNATYTSGSNSGKGDLKLDDTQDVWVPENGMLKSTNASKTATSDKFLAYEESPANLFTVRSSSNADTVTITEADNSVPETVDYVLTDKLEAGKEYLIANGDTGKVYVVSTEAGGSRVLKGFSATVADNKITLAEEATKKAAFTCDLEDESNENSTRLKNGEQYLYADSSNGLRLFTLTSSANGKHWHYKADGKNLLWFFKDTSNSDGYADTSSTYKYYLECNDGNFTDAHVSSTSLSNTETPAIYLFVKAEEAQQQVDVTGVSLDKKTLLLETGRTETLTATVEPANATNKTVTWSSSNTDVATVENGVVKAVAEGSAVITVKTVDGDFTDTCNVTVNAPETVDYVLTDKLEAGKEYLIANGDTGKVYVVSTEAGGSRVLKGLSATVADNKITLTEEATKKAAFTCDLEDESNENSTRLKNGEQYLYADSSNGLRMFTLTSSANGKHWHYKAGGKNLLWFFKDTSASDGYTDTSSTYKYYLECNDGNFTDAHVSSTSLSNTETLAIYLFVKSDGIQHEHVYGEPDWTWANDYSSATATFNCMESDDTKTIEDDNPSETVVSDATCLNDKVVRYVATVTLNGEEYSDTTEEITVDNTALGHKWGDWEITKEATCTEKGEKSRKCTRCNAVDTEELAAKGHTIITDEAVPATCTEKGKTEGSHCSVCNEVIVAQEETPALGHKWGDWEVTKEATCTEKGEKSRKCTRCNAVDTEELAAKGHTIITDEAVPATCTEKGKTEGSHCSVCNEVIVAQEETPALGHKWGDWDITKEATCTEKGEKSRKCTRCDAVDTEELAAKGHTIITDEAVPATCTEKGKTEGSHCSVCNEVITAQKETPALGHEWGDWEVTKEATCTEKGEKSRKCTRCDAIDTEELAMADHTIVIDKAVPATCTKPGKTEGSHCSVCNKVIVKQTVIPALGHKWKHVVNKAGYLKDGVDYYQCTECHIITNKKVLTGYANYYVKSFKVKKEKKAFTVTWKKQSKANQKKFNGYQIRYSTSPLMSGAKYVTAGKNSKSKKIKGLAKKTRYYVQVRTYTTHGGKKFYSQWSLPKAVKTK